MRTNYRETNQKFLIKKIKCNNHYHSSDLFLWGRSGKIFTFSKEIGKILEKELTSRIGYPKLWYILQVWYIRTSDIGMQSFWNEGVELKESFCDLRTIPFLATVIRNLAGKNVFFIDFLNRVTISLILLLYNFIDEEEI